MKKRNRILISALLILTFCLVPVSVLADEATGPAAPARDVTFENGLAADLRTLGLFKGTSATNFDLERAPSRLEVLVMLIRVLGKEQDALDGEWTHPFTDVDPWADPYVGYAYENGLTKGVSATKFGNATAGAGTYLTYMLRALGYSDTNNEDFAWDNPHTLARAIGILPTVTNTEAFIRADLVTISYAALSATLKGSERTLAQKLMEAGAFSAETYAANYNIAKLTAKENESKTELDSESLYKTCSPAVFYIEIKNASGTTTASGSGFFIRADGLAVTNYHVIEGASSATVTLPDSGVTCNVTGVYDCDPFTDWALIQVEGSGFKTLTMNPMPVATGATVYTIGSPKGLQNSLSAGMISNARREVDGAFFIQTTAAISAGSSGGALLNRFGEVIGITSNTIASGQNLNFARPISCVAAGKTDECTPLSEMTWTFVRYFCETDALSLKLGETAQFGLDCDYYTYTSSDPFLSFESDDENVAAADFGYHYGECVVHATGVGETVVRITNDLSDDVFEIPVTVTADPDSEPTIAYVASKEQVRLNAGDTKSVFVFTLPYSKEDVYYVRSESPKVATVRMTEPTEDGDEFILEITGVANGETTVTLSNNKTKNVLTIPVVVEDRYDTAFSTLRDYLIENGRYEESKDSPEDSGYVIALSPDDAVVVSYAYLPQKDCILMDTFVNSSGLLLGVELTMYADNRDMLIEYGVPAYDTSGFTELEASRFGQKTRTLTFDRYEGMSALRSQLEGSFTEMFAVSLVLWDTGLEILGEDTNNTLDLYMTDFGFYNFDPDDYFDE